MADGRPCYNWQKSYDTENATSRDDHSFRQIAKYVSENKDNPEERARAELFSERTGITGLSVFTRLPTLFFPSSFPPCTMHLFYENVSHTMFEHLAGRYFVRRPPPAAPPDQHDASNANIGNKNNNTKDPPVSGRKGPAFIRQKGTMGPFVRKREDPYNIKPKDWDTIGKDTARSNETYPDQLGEEMTNLITSFRKMKAANWQRFLYHQSPIYFRGCLPKEHYLEWMNMVEAMRLSTRKVLEEEEIEEVSNVTKPHI